MKKILTWLKARIPTKRRLIQLYCALLFNANIKGFVTGQIYKGPIKNICTPGLNCYSCPGASGACPIGALQNACAASNKRAPYYVFGIILLYSILFGRMICGFFCPFGLVQDLLYKIKTPKVKKSKFTRILSYLKYVILVFLALLIPLLYMMRDRGIPSFCKYICPAGVLEGAIGLLSHVDNSAELLNLGPLFAWKFSLFVAIILLCIFISRFFCRFLCPLGALYGLFNRFSILGIKLDRDKCIDCGKCHAKCKMDIRHVGDHECINCGECIDVCPTNAISWRGSQIFLPKNEIGTPVADEQAGCEGCSPVPIEGEANVDTLPAADTSTVNTKTCSKASGVNRRAFIIKLTSLILAVAVLLGALVYYNFIYEAPIGDTSYCYDNNKDGACDICTLPLTDKNGNEIVYGNELWSLCVGAHLEEIDGDGKTGNIANPVVTDGKIVIINFWGVWCDGCKKELPDFNRIADEYAGEVTVYAIHTTTDEEYASDHIKNNYSEWDNMIFALDTRISGANADKYYTALGFTNGSYPVTVILTPDGTIEYKYASELTYDELKSAIEEIKSIYS